MAVEVEEELAGGERGVEDDFGELALHLVGGEFFEGGWDEVGEVENAGAEGGSGQAGGAEFERAIAGVGDVAELPGDVLAEVSFEVEDEIAGGVGDAGEDLPGGLVVGEGFDLLVEGEEIAAKLAG